MEEERSQPALMRSFYLLELWVGPGGARKAHYYLFDTIEEIKQTLENDLADPIEGAYLVLWYGETINLIVYSEGKVVWEKDLHPYITFYIPGFPPLEGMDDISMLDFFDLASLAEKDLDEDDRRSADLIRDDFSAFLWSDAKELSAYRVEIDWAAMDIPALEGQRLQPDEAVICWESYTQNNAEFKFGYNSLEG